MYDTFNAELINRKALAKSLVGKTVYLKGNKDKTWLVVSYTNRGYSVLEGGDIQDAKLLRVLEEVDT